MDEKNIYIACNRMKQKMNWDEWHYVGEGNDFLKLEVKNLINTYFDEEELFLIIDRTKSFSTSKAEAADHIKENLKGNIFLSNKIFYKMIEFNAIGVARTGYISEKK